MIQWSDSPTTNRIWGLWMQEVQKITHFVWHFSDKNDPQLLICSHCMIFIKNDPMMDCDENYFGGDWFPHSLLSIISLNVWISNIKPSVILLNTTTLGLFLFLDKTQTLKVLHDIALNFSLSTSPTLQSKPVVYSCKIWFCIYNFYPFTALLWAVCPTMIYPSGFCSVRQSNSYKYHSEAQS